MAARDSSLTINLGGEQIKLLRVEGVEGLSRPFQVSVDLVSEHIELDLLPHLGKPALVTLSQDGKLMRYFHGHLVEGEFLAAIRDGFQYRLILRPWSHYLSHNQDYAIFQDKSALDIINEVLAKSPFAKIDDSGLSTKPAKRPYTVQYGESDFAFISRLMEQEGIYYFYEHSADRHLMRLCDSPAAHAPAKHAKLIYNPYSAGVANTDSGARGGGPTYFVSRWTERVVSGGEAKVTLRDFDFEVPKKPLQESQSAPDQHPLDAIEVYEWPGEYKDSGDGVRFGRAILDSRRAERRTYSGDAQLPSLAAGYKVTLTGHPNGRFDGDYLITRTHHVTSSETYASGAAADSHDVVFEAIPAAHQWRAPIVTPRPVVRGPESAIVTGPGGEEIFTDEYGRVKVRFHWDRGKTPGEKSTCWIRVSQTGGLGNIILPRVGHEVIVDFLDGDPDRPIVVGRVFNADNKPIYKLDANKTRALWRTKTYGEQKSYGAAMALDSGAPKANELRFEDLGGSEEIYLHAERDMKVRVRHKESHHIGLDQEWKIGGSRNTRIEVNDTLDVGKAIKIDAGSTINITAMTSITLKCGSSTIKIDPTSVTIQTVQLKMKADATANLESPMTTVKGDGMLVLKGGMTMIN